MENDNNLYLKAVSKLNKASCLYYNQSKSIMSDLEYDKLYKFVVEYEKEYPDEVVDYSPTKFIGYDPISNFEKVEHSTKMYSLNNTYTKLDIAQFDTKVQNTLQTHKRIIYNLQWKIDGLSVALRYNDDGVLYKAITRGNGLVGDDVTNNIMAIPNIPKKIDVDHAIEVRGEVCISNKDFRKINKQMAKSKREKFTHPRNLASGTLKSHNPMLVRERKLLFIAWELLDDTDTVQEEIDRLEKYGFKTAKIDVLNNNLPVDYVISTWASFNDIENKEDIYLYPIDGLVMKVNDKELHEYLGYTEKYPKWAMALKFDQLSVKSKLVGVDFQVGSSGHITPVAKIKPVIVDKTKVSSVTLHNFDIINELDIRLGDDVFVIKAGGVIPAIIGVDKKNRTGDEITINIPKTCPVCGSELTKNGTYLVCTNNSCPGVIKAKLDNNIKFLEIKNLGPKTVQKLISFGFIHKFYDIYKLTVREISKATSSRILAEKAYKNIKKKKTLKLNEFIYCLNIPGVGKTNSMLLSQYFKTYDNFINMTMQDLLRIDGFGDKGISGIIQYFQDNMDDILKFKSYVDVLDYKDKTTGKFYGTKFSITGKIDGYRKSDISNYIQNEGGTIATSVSKDVDILLYSDTETEKYRRAIKYNVKLIPLADFVKEEKIEKI